MIHGPDVSGYQTKIHWPTVRKACEFAIVKVTEGNNYTNPHARTQVLGAISVGLLTMLYHFAKPSGAPGDLESWKADARAEAKRFDDLADAFEAELGVKLFCILDVERNTALTAEEKPYWRAWCNEFRRWSKEEGKRIVGWYSGQFFTKELGLDASWCNTLLWIAAYPKTFRSDANYGYWPKTIAPWFRADLWQHGGGDPVEAGGNASTCPGVEGGCDFNTFAGDRAQLEELIGVTA